MIGELDLWRVRFQHESGSTRTVAAPADTSLDSIAQTATIAWIDSFTEDGGSAPDWALNATIHSVERTGRAALDPRVSTR